MNDYKVRILQGVNGAISLYFKNFDEACAEAKKHRPYTHVVVCFGWEYNGQPVDKWGALTWCGRLDLAERAMRNFAGWGFKELKIAPVNPEVMPEVAGE